MKHSQQPYWTHPFSLAAAYALAVSVSLGVALVSISKLLVVLALVAKIISLWRSKQPLFKNTNYLTFSALALALTWLAVSLLWSEAKSEGGWRSEQMVGFMRHARLWVLPAVYFLIETRGEACKVLAAIVLGQLFVVISSWLLWLGVALPWAFTIYEPSMGIVFSSTLEQPVMSTLMLIVVWFLRDEIAPAWRKPLVFGTLLLTITNVFFVMTGRTGYLVMLLALTLAVFWQLPRRYRPVVFLLPLLMAFTLWLVSARFQDRMQEIAGNVVAYQHGNAKTSQGARLDYWAKSLQAIQSRPLTGHGAGSWRSNYLRLGGDDQINPPSNPHHQFLLWAVEGGLIGLLLLCAFFAALYRDASKLEERPAQALKATIGVTLLMGLMNCPLFGAGMGEFILLIVAALLAYKKMVQLPK